MKIIKGIKLAGGLIAIVLFITVASSSSPKNKAQENIPSQSQEQNTEPTSTTTTQEGTSNQGSVIQVKQTEQSVGKANAELYKVVDVVDGDTIKVSIDGSIKTLRLIGIDTPETVDPRKPVQCFGKEASNKAKELLLNKSVRLEADPTQGELDKYQRSLRYVFMEDGTFFNKWMIENGYAHEYTYTIPYKYQTEFKAAEKSARENLRGLWNPSVCPTVQPAQVAPVKVPTAQTTTVTSPTGGHIFYTSSYYSAKLYYCDTDEAWKALSSSYLKSFSSEAELLSVYKRTLNEPCK